MSQEILDKASKVRFVFTDCDGVLTDAGVYYGEQGEVLKRFNIRDGMGVRRLREQLGVDTGIITGETSPSVAKRAEKLKITQLYLGRQEKCEALRTAAAALDIPPDRMAYIGDDVNDLEVMKLVGLSACPEDAMVAVREKVDYICRTAGGHGAFREFAELIISAQKGAPK